MKINNINTLSALVQNATLASSFVLNALYYLHYAFHNYFLYRDDKLKMTEATIRFI